MTAIEKKVFEAFRTLVLKRIPVCKMILFGSRARGDSSPYSDMDILVITEEKPDEWQMDYISDCAWEAGFESGIVIVPIVFSRDEWENSPERYSLLARAVERDGIPI